MVIMMGAVHKRLSIFNYHDYRQFLADCMALPGENSKSLRSWAKEFTVSPSFLSLLLKGKRNISSELAEKICKILSLTLNERSFFLKLVEMAGETELEGKKTAYRKLKRTTLYSLRTHEDQVVHEYITHWYYIAIREMATLPSFQFDPQWIREHLNFEVSISKIDEAVRFLLLNKFIEIDDEGRPKQTQREIRCDGVVLRLAQAEYHEQMVNLGVRSFFETQQSSRDLLGKTIALSNSEFEQVKKIIQEAFAKIQVVADTSERENVDQPKRVFQLTTLAYALSEAIPTKPKDDGDV